MSIAVAGLFLWFRREIFLDRLFTISGLRVFLGVFLGAFFGVVFFQGGRVFSLPFLFLFTFLFFSVLYFLGGGGAVARGVSVGREEDPE